jgi:hypothetical protein
VDDLFPQGKLSPSSFRAVKHHGTNCFRSQFTFHSSVFDRDGRFTILVDDLEWLVLHIPFNFSFVRFTTNKTFTIKDRVSGFEWKAIFKLAASPTHMQKK